MSRNLPAIMTATAIFGALGAAGVAGPAVAQDFFGLDAPLGVPMGMHLDEAVETLVARGYRLRQDLPDVVRMTEAASAGGVTLSISAVPGALPGLMVESVGVRDAAGTREAPFSASVFLTRAEEGAVYTVRLDAIHSDNEEGYGQGATYNVFSRQHLRGVEGQIDWFGIEWDLRDAAGVPHSCGEGSLAEGTVSLTWILVEGEGESDMSDGECAMWGGSWVAGLGSAPLQEIVEGRLDDVRPTDSLWVSVMNGIDGMGPGVFLVRTDTGIRLAGLLEAIDGLGGLGTAAAEAEPRVDGLVDY